MDWNYINYLHYGNSLDALLSILDLNGDFYHKEKLVRRFQINRTLDRFLLEVMDSYGGVKSKQIYLPSFKQDIRKSLELRKVSSKLKCRGFSYILHESIDIDCPDLRKDVNLRIALMPNEKLFYPKRLRRYFRRQYYSHYRFDRYPSICFALGKIINEKCFISIMQSDFIHRNPSFIRDHFRGWRKILMHNIIEVVKGRCNSIYIPSAHKVFCCCHPNFSKSDTTPKLWFDIYDRTAADFMSSIVYLSKPINIQIYQNLKPVMVQEFYQINVT